MMLFEADKSEVKTTAQLSSDSGSGGMHQTVSDSDIKSNTKSSLPEAAPSKRVVRKKVIYRLKSQKPVILCNFRELW